MQRFSYIGDVGLGKDGGYNAFFMPWPGIKLVRGFRKGFSSKKPSGEAGYGSPPTLWSPVWGP